MQKTKKCKQKTNENLINIVKPISGSSELKSPIKIFVRKQKNEMSKIIEFKIQKNS